MINLLKILLFKVFSMLPDSPFTAYYTEMHMDFYDYLNWFLPVDICAAIFLSWITCMVVYCIFVLIKKIAYIVISMLAKTISIAKFFV